MALEKYSIAWCLFFAAQYLRGMDAKQRRGGPVSLAKVADVIQGYAAAKIVARKTWRKKRYVADKEKANGSRDK